MLLKILNRLALRFSKSIRKNRGKKFADGIEKIADRFHRDLNNVNFDMETNGEMRALKIISSANPACIFDVGGNTGEWSSLMAGMNPSAVIHGFELVPATFKAYVQRTKDFKNVIPNNFGLSDNNGNVIMNMGPESETATAFKIEGMQYHDEYYKEKISCTVRKAAEYIKEKNIGQIDFVKIDVEGMDLRVIRGFEDKLAQVRSLQFEYGIFNISSHDLLADFCLYLNRNGFITGKIFPRCVKFFDYHFDMENFHGSNFIAVKKEEHELIEKLKG